MNKQQAIKEAKKIARDDYINWCKEVDIDTPYNHKRKWVRYNRDYGYTFGLCGTPDKAFVVVIPSAGIVLAKRQDLTTIKEIKFGENIDAVK